MSDRMRCLVSHVRDHSMVYDLCCDHGYIGWQAWDRKPLAGLCFVDQSANALRAVHAALKERKLEQDPRIRILTAAAEAITIDARPSDFIIAGVGIRTIVQILKNLLPHGLGAHRLILCPEKGSLELRRYLRAQGYGLIAEDIVREAGRFREVIVIEAKGGPIHLMSEGYADREDPLVQNFVATFQAWHAAVEAQQNRRSSKDSAARDQGGLSLSLASKTP